jgi:hypothetical protein
LLRSQPEDVDVAFFVVRVGWFAELGEEGGGGCWGEGLRD